MYSIVWLAVGGSSVGGSGFIGSCSRYDDSSDNVFGACCADFSNSINLFQPVLDFCFEGPDDVAGCYESTAIVVLGFFNGILCKSPVPTQRKTSKLQFYFYSSWNIKVMFYDVLVCCRDFGCCGVYTLGDVTDTEITAVGNIGVSTLEDGTDAELTSVEINNTQIVVHNEIAPPNE